MSEQNFDCEIRVVANGYIVQPARNIQRDCYPSATDIKVFESFDSLTAYLRGRLPIYPVFMPAPIPPKGKRK